MSITVNTVNGTSLTSDAQTFNNRGSISSFAGNGNISSLADSQSSNMPSDNRSARRGLLGVFGRGFFAKPVNHSEEENYRYLMALDR